MGIVVAGANPNDGATAAVVVVVDTIPNDGTADCGCATAGVVVPNPNAGALVCVGCTAPKAGVLVWSVPNAGALVCGVPNAETLD